jgi:uroporphyrinogen decarboxylase
MDYKPDYNNLLDVAFNREPKTIPIYEHNISDEFMEKVLKIKFRHLINGDRNDKIEYFKHYCGFFKDMGYDTVSFEQCITSILPGSGALYKNTPPVIKTKADFDNYPWDEVEDMFFAAFTENFEILSECMPNGMKAVGGPGNGLFEIIQDLCGYQELCYMSVDEPELYEQLFERITVLMCDIWKRFLDQFADIYCVCRFGDDLGFNTQTLLPEKSIKALLISRYARIVEIIHSYDKPFLLHSCGYIFGVMDDLIDIVKIDSKHSNEEKIAPFKKWVDLYGDKIGNFGGIDVGRICDGTREEIEAYVTKVYNECIGHGGFALGSGNSIPDYIPVEGYLAMIETSNKLRLK